MHKKRIPMRMCTGCGEMKPKPELVRVVKAPDQKDEQGNIYWRQEKSPWMQPAKSRGAVLMYVKKQTA